LNNSVANKKEYFKGLNGIRALAAIGVVIGHVLYILDHSFIVNYAHAAAIVFFTLSGFLITYLLLEEKELTEKVDLKKFYLRRILRIWPLYFFYIGIIILLHYYVIGDGIRNLKNVKYFFVFLQNYCVYFLQRQPTDMGHLWSIGVEEQFYFVWPIIFLFTKNIKKFLLGFIPSILFIRGVLKIYGDYTGDLTPFNFSISCAYDSIATGALFSYFYKIRNGILMKYAKSFWVPLTFIAFVLLIVFYRFNFFSIYSDNAVSLITAAFIVNQITTIKKYSVLENPVMTFLGKISYGIYMYHPFFISLFLFVFSKNKIAATPIVMLILVISSTVITSYISYEILEKPFLRIKKKYSPINHFKGDLQGAQTTFRT